jgi:prepilin-type N-terminal cleavage/methylation domain-containing protein
MRGCSQADPCAARRARAFSLVEMLVTLAIILILFVLMHGFSSKSHQMQQKTVCLKNLSTIHVALEIFARDHEGFFPVLTNARTSEEPLALLVPKYTAMTEMFICPGSKDARIPDGEPLTRHRISYAYYMGQHAESTGELLLSDQQIDARPKPVGAQVFSLDGKKPGNNHHQYGGNLLYLDGRTERIAATTPYSLVPTQGVTLLNPRQP